MNCDRCGASAERVLGLVKDGAVYSAFRCEGGHLRVVDTQERTLTFHVEERDGVRVATMRCGANTYIFDRRLFRKALREVLRAARAAPSDLVLDLSHVGFVSEPLLGAVRYLERGMERRGRSLWVVASSQLVASELVAAAPRLAGRIAAKVAEAVARFAAAASGMPGTAAAGMAGA